MHTERKGMTTPTKVLLVDDEASFVASSSRLLRNRGFTVIEAFRGQQALEMLMKNDIHVAILDVKMPEMDGLALLKEIKTRFPLVEVIMLTGHATFDAAVSGLKMGALDYLMKPCRIEDLVKKIEEAREKRDINMKKQAHAAGKTP